MNIINWFRNFYKKEEKIQYELPREEVKIKNSRIIDTNTTTSIEKEDNANWMYSTSKPNPDWGNDAYASKEERKKREFEENKKAIKKEMELFFSQTPVGQTYESIKNIKKVFVKSAPPPPPKRNGPKKASH